MRLRMTGGDAATAVLLTFALSGRSQHLRGVSQRRRVLTRCRVRRFAGKHLAGPRDSWSDESVGYQSVGILDLEEGGREGRMTADH